MKHKHLLLTAIAVTAALLMGGCGAQEDGASVVEESAAFSVPEPTATPEPTAAPAVMAAYDLGGVEITLPEGFTANVALDGMFTLRGTSSLITGEWFDADYFSYLGVDYPDSSEAAAEALWPAAAAEEVLSVTTEGGRTVVEYISDGDVTRWATYAVFERGDTLCWKVEFFCPEGLYDELRPSFVEWAASMILPETVDIEGMHEMTSVSGLFSLVLPNSCLVIDDATTAEELTRYGMTESDAQAFLDDVRTRAEGRDVIYRADFGAMLTVTVDMDAGMTQAEMPEREDELYIDEALVGEDYTYEGVVMVGDNPNVFYLVRVSHGGYDELGFTTAHDGTGSMITFSFAGFSDEEVQEILETLVMLEISG